MGAGPHAPPDRQTLARACAAGLKIFPLPGVVVLPGTPTPFHVFEPRYRALLADALAGDRILAVPTLVSEEGAVEQFAAVRPVAGAGFVEWEERLPDGRSHVVFRCLARVRLMEELPTGALYRAFRAEILEDRFPPGGPAALETSMEAVAQLVLELSLALPEESGSSQFAETVAQLRDPSALADLVAAAVVSDTDARYRLLETLDVAKRLEQVEAEVASVLLMVSAGRAPRA
jgi:Lon protease-like protein